MSSGRGRLEIAIALSMTADGVTVDASKKLFTTKPGDLFGRTFNEIGVAGPQMAVFKQHLAALLPNIKNQIGSISEDADQTIEQVATFIKIELLKDPHGSGGRPFK